MEVDDSKTLYTPEGDEIKWLPKKYENYLDKTTLLFGGSGSGKTTVIEEILYLIKDHVPNFIVIASENSQKAYKNKLPARCIKGDLSKDKLQKIWSRQYYTTQLYNTANDINILESLFNRMPDRETSIMLNALKMKAEECIRAIEGSNGLNFAQKKAQKSAIEELQIQKIKSLYKQSIRRNKTDIEAKCKDLTPHEKIAVEYLDLNPRLAIVIDDCTDKFMMWMKFFKKSEVNPFESIFYQGRHNYITLIFAAHDDKIIDTQLRKNTRVTIYTTSQSLMTSVGKASNGFTPQERKEISRLSGKVFCDENGIKSHKKFCYVREDTYPFRYTIANMLPDFQICCDPLIDMSAKMPKKEDSIVENPYVKELVKG